MSLYYEGRFELGDVIKTYDFRPRPGISEMYVIGKIVRIGRCQHGYDAFFIECQFDSTVDDQYCEHSRAYETVLVPVGMSEFSEYEGRISKV